MKAWSLALLIPSLSLADPALIHLHAPKNPNTQLFGYDTLCQLESLDTNTGRWDGVCRYVGYRGVYQYAQVSWNDTGAGTFVGNCRLSSDYRAFEQQYPVCPAQTLGPYAVEEVGGYPIRFYLQGIDPSGAQGAMLDNAGPNTPALVTP
jgi:hypothetical protein